MKEKAEDKITTIDLLNTIQEEKKYTPLPLIEKNPYYRPFKQNTITDNITKGLIAPKQLSLFDGGYATTNLDPRANPDFVLCIEQWNEIAPLLSKEVAKDLRTNQSTDKLLKCLLIKLAETGFRSMTASISLKEYAELTSKKDMKELRKRVKVDLATLKRVKFSYTPKHKTRYNRDNYTNIYLFGGTEKIENGHIYFKFNEDFFKIFAEQPSFLYFPVEGLQFNERKNPHSYMLFSRIVSHKRINTGKKNENIIGVKTLYDYCVSLPRYDQVNGRFSQLILEPFERDLDVIKSFSWHYDTQEPPKSFNEWLQSNIVIDWKLEFPKIEKKKSRKPRKNKVVNPVES